jgi:ABC-type transport system involved in Fe-S cluster assembly fused permease/ATPase subunit
MYDNDNRSILKNMKLTLQKTKDFILKPISTVKTKVKSTLKKINEELPMLQYLWPSDNLQLKVFLILSMIFMFLGKWLNVKVPFMLQSAIDAITTDVNMRNNQIAKGASLTLFFYGFSRALSVVFSEIKTVLFAHVSQNVLKKFASQIFSHLHQLDSEFHLNNPSGVISVSYVRAVRGFQTFLFQIVFSVLPTALELYLVSSVLFRKCGAIFSAITISSFSIYIAFTIWITQWRVRIRNELVDIDNARNGYFIDSILNHEVVKLFTNEAREQLKFNNYLTRIQELSIETTYAIAVLNLGQAIMFASGLTLSLLTALKRVGAGTLSVGDLVAVNSMLLQLSVPFNFIGYTYQELRQAFVDMSYMRNVLVNTKATINDVHKDVNFDIVSPRAGPSLVEFRNVSFSYGVKSDELLKEMNLVIKPGQNVAIVGPSGSGKSTTMRLITRMLDPTGGQILVDGQDIKTVSLSSLRNRVAVVPQDTSLFDDTVEFNIKYGNSYASQNDIAQVIDKCNLIDTIKKLPQGLQTKVGERGARLSGGERQKISIARALLRDPSLILCDEVTSSVDAFAERDIVQALKKATQQRTTLTIAHRLSSISHCDLIIVMDKGRIIEQGTHDELLKIRQGTYVNMWNAQNTKNMIGEEITIEKEDVNFLVDNYDEPDNEILDLLAKHNKPHGSPMDLLTPEHFDSLAGVLKMSTSLPATNVGRQSINYSSDDNKDIQLERGMQVSEEVLKK